MSVHAIELSILTEIDLDVGGLAEKFSDQLEDVEKSLIERASLHVRGLCHLLEAWLDQGH